MKICPNCNNEQEFPDSEFCCPLCGISLIPKTKSIFSIGSSNAISGDVSINASGISSAATPNFSLGDANAISGGIHYDAHKTDSHNIDSHDNNSVTTIDNSIRVEASKTVEQLSSEARSSFIDIVSQLLQTGIFDLQTQEKINKARVQYNISEEDATQIVTTFRRNNTQATNKGDDIAVDSVKKAIETCNLDILKLSYPRLKALSQKSMSSSVQFYTHLVAMSNNPQHFANACVFSKTENYWQLFWACVASVKIGSENKNILFSQIGTFENYPQGNILLLNAIEYLYAYRKNPNQIGFFNEAIQCLQDSESMGISEELSMTWCTINELANNTTNPSTSLQFYYQYTFPELIPKPTILNIPIPQMTPSTNMQEQKGQPYRNKMIGASATKNNLQQMQGFNPLQELQNINSGISTQCNIIGLSNTTITSGIAGIQGELVSPSSTIGMNNNNQEN